MTTSTLLSSPHSEDLHAAASTARFTPAAGPGQHGQLRLTRRGRIVVVVALLAGVLVLGFSLGHVPTSGAAAAPVAGTVVVEPGDTLWSIAARVAPQHDPRSVVAQLMTVNHLAGGSVQVGERLRLPA